MATIPKNGDFSKILDKGENPYGFTACTPNGVERDGAGADGQQWKFGPGVSGPRWDGVEMPPEQFIGATLPRTARGVKGK